MLITKIEDYCRYIIIRTFHSRANIGDPVYVAMVVGFVDGYDYFMSLDQEPIEAFKMAGKNAMIDAKEEFKRLQENQIPMTSLEPNNIIAIKAKEYSDRTTEGEEYNQFMDHNLRCFYAFGFEAGYRDYADEKLAELFASEIETVRSRLKNNQVKLNLSKISLEYERYNIRRR